MMRALDINAVIKFATGYAPLLIQVYATSAFDFDQGGNGWLLSEFGLVRSIFLMFLFLVSLMPSHFLLNSHFSHLPPAPSKSFSEIV